MSKINPEPNLIHIMGCYVLGNPNGEKVRVQNPESFCSGGSADQKLLDLDPSSTRPPALAPPSGSVLM